MLTGAPPTDRASVTPAPRRRVWPWAAGSIIITLAVIVGTLVGQRLALRARLAAEVAPAPALPPLAVNAIIHPQGQIAQLALDPHTHTLVAQIATCVAPASQPATGQATTGQAATSCNSTPGSLVNVSFFDGATGALRARGEVIAPEVGGVFALTDTTRSVTYFLASNSVTTFSDVTGKQTGAYTSAAAASAVAAGIDAQTGVIYTLDGKGALSAFTAADGQPLAATTIPSTAKLPAGVTPQIVVDASSGRVYVITVGRNLPTMLSAFNATDLTPLGSWQVAPNLRPSALGPFDPVTHSLYLSEDSQAMWRVNLATLPASGAGQTLNAQQDTALKGVTHFGRDNRSGATLVMNSAGIEAFTGATQPYAGMPLVHAPTIMAVDTSLLPVDASTGLAYVPGDDNTILIVNLARPTSFTAPNAATAALIARVGLAKLLPDTNQNPPFVAAQTFPLGAGLAPRQYFIHYSDLGWKGPYPGTASISDPKAGAAPGDYTMTFTITWNQLFLHQHSWTVEVTPDGRTHLLADSGDGLP